MQNLARLTLASLILKPLECLFLRAFVLKLGLRHTVFVLKLTCFLRIAVVIALATFWARLLAFI